MDDSGPTTIEVVKGELPVEYKGGWPDGRRPYNTPTAFLVRAKFANGVELDIRDDTENGVTFEGTGGRIFVTRDRIDLSGGSVEAPVQEPRARVAPGRAAQGEAGRRPHGQLLRVRAATARRPSRTSGRTTAALTTCHLANIAIRLGGRKLTWDPAKEEIVGDSEANAWLTRPQRSGYEVTA